MLKNKLKITLKKRKAITGFLFVLPFLVGFQLFFFRPMLQSIIFSLNELRVSHLGFELNYIGLDNFKYALRVDPDFIRLFTETIQGILINIPSVIIFSFFAAAVLNQKFKGRLLARIIFFLPVILTAGIIAEIEGGDIMARSQGLDFGLGIESALRGEGGTAFFSSNFLTSLLLEMRLPEEFVLYVVNAASLIPTIINRAAIPILIFLAGLQSIPASLYEAADIEGASGWQSFWKITVPLISPLIIVNIVFIIIYSFTAPGNQLVEHISKLAWGRGIYGVSVAMTWLYFVAIAVILIIISIIISKFSYELD